MPRTVSKRVLVIDNYDSFTWNLVALLKQGGADVEVIFNDDPKCLLVQENVYNGILLSPGPGTPDTAGYTLNVLEKYAGEIPVFGVCLGHQSIGQHFGLKVLNAPEPVHGKASEISHDGKGVFQGLGKRLKVIRYHSLVVSEPGDGFPLVVTSRTDDGVIMGLRHRELALESVQFHPDSAATEQGQAIINNWLITI